VCTDANKNVYFTDYANSRIREIKPTEYNHPIAVFVNPGGNIYVSDTGNERIRMINTGTGIINTIAGTGMGGYNADGIPATTAKINQPYGLWVDNAAPVPNVYFADSHNDIIRKILGTGIITTIAGQDPSGTPITPHPGFTGDGTAAVGAELNTPTDVFVDNRGMSWSYNKIIIADQGNNRIRMIDTCGDINTYDGNGTAGYTGDGGVPLAAEFNSPLFVITDPKENIYVTDFNDNHVREIVRNANVAKVQVGSMQREMNFLVQTCFYTSPTGEVDTFLGGGIHRIDSTHFYGCANSGNFILTTNPAESDTTLDITVTATGLPSGFVFSIGTTNNTPHPHDTVTVNTATVAPGNYTFYLTYTDNHCPLTGTNTTAFSVDILPVPTITDSLITHATCIDPAAYRIIPGGTGKPWTIKVTGGLGGPALDTFQVFASDTGAFVDSLKPGTDTLVIFTSVSNQCSVSLPITIDTSKFTISDAGVDPTYCGGNTGKIGVVGFGVTLGHPDTMYYDFNGVGQTPQPFIVPAGNIDTITGLYAGTYTHVVMQEGLCFSKDTLAAVTLNNPPFVFRSVTTKSPTQCGYCDGADTVWGMHPSQLDTITYTYSISGLAPFTTASVNHSIGSDSLDVITGLCAGYYTNIVVNTAGVCRDSLPGPYHLISPGLKDSFITATHYGCNGDTVMFTNFSQPDSMSLLTYRWYFGDGASSTETNPSHFYTNTINNTVTIILNISNTKCDSTDTATVTLNNTISGGFTFTPDPYVCQDSLVTFTNTSSGTNPTYTWLFGDGTTSTAVNPTHVYTYTGKNIQITLVAQENIMPVPVTPDTYVPCYDTVVQTISIDSFSSVSITASDSVLCQGEGITFTGIYSTLGDTTVIWSFGDGSSFVDQNPILHAYDQASLDSTFTVSLSVKNRSCPSGYTSRNVKVFPYPSIYMGPDLTMCPGSNPITLIDETNQSNPKASWLWSTGETTPGITVIKPGTYTNVVTIDGCSSADTVTVQKDCYMDIPNAFTPNGDGTNDYFFPRQMLTEGLVTFKMDIYNRWGQMIYETTNTDGRGWDGNFNNQPQPEDVYIYIIDATFKDGQIEHHQGNVTLLR